MSNYDEFRIVIAPDIGNAGQWKVQVSVHPLKEYEIPPGTISPVFTRSQLRRLRSRHNWPNLAELRDIGGKIWKSLMTTEISAGFMAARSYSTTLKRQLRVRLVLLGQENERVIDDGVRLSELPVEALYLNNISFLAIDANTPISRSLQSQREEPAQSVPLPLRLLVVTATPNDKPRAEATKEKEVIQKALGKLAQEGGPLAVEYCEPATRAELNRRLSLKPYNILHFIGHGGFSVYGNDPTPRGHLCFVREDTGGSDQASAEEFFSCLRNTEIRLVIITACSSAAPADPDAAGASYDVAAFDGVAQHLLAAPYSKVTAAIAMQFDIESDAAVAFTRELYSNLFSPNKSIDEAVTQARNGIKSEAGYGEGHRAWITPVLYSRCQDGKVFDLVPLRAEMDEATLKEIRNLQIEEKVLRDMLDWTKGQPPEARKGMAKSTEYVQSKLKGIQERRGTLLGETIQLSGGEAHPGEEIDFRLHLRLRLKGAISSLKIKLNHPADKVSFVRATAGQHSADNVPLVGQPDAGKLILSIDRPSGLREWDPDRYEVAVLRFRVAADVQGPCVIDLGLDANNCEVWRDGQKVDFKTLDGVLFVNESN
jgi:hypothetical protein